MKKFIEAYKLVASRQDLNEKERDQAYEIIKKKMNILTGGSKSHDQELMVKRFPPFNDAVIGRFQAVPLKKHVADYVCKNTIHGNPNINLIKKYRLLATEYKSQLNELKTIGLPGAHESIATWFLSFMGGTKSLTGWYHSFKTAK